MATFRRVDTSFPGFSREVPSLSAECHCGPLVRELEKVFFPRGTSFVFHLCRASPFLKMDLSALCEIEREAWKHERYPIVRALDKAMHDAGFGAEQMAATGFERSYYISIQAAAVKCFYLCSLRPSRRLLPLYQRHISPNTSSAASASSKYALTAVPFYSPSAREEILLPAAWPEAPPKAATTATRAGTTNTSNNNHNSTPTANSNNI